MTRPMRDPAGETCLASFGLEGRWLGYSTGADWRDRAKPS